MKYPRILAAIRSARWAVTPPTLQAIRDTLSARLNGRLASDPMDDMEDDQEDPMLPPYEITAPGVAVVRLHGIIGRGLSSMEMACGGCDIARVENNLRAVLADVGVAAVVMDIDSPGGTCSGVEEFSNKIAELSMASSKPVYAFASGQCASAAYWIACGCTGIACSPSSDVGSIGVYMALVDESENWKAEGYKLVLIKAGDHKAAGIAGSQVTPAQIALWQADVDFIYGRFVRAVQAARPGIATDVLQGQTFYGERAVAAGLVDEIATDLTEMAAEVSPIS